MQIGGLQKLSLIDYPGKLACVVFFAGCSFRCPWCHNPKLVLPEEIRGQSKIPIKDVFEFLKKRSGALEGVVLGGGEPTINPGLIGFCRRMKNLGYKIKLDTNGSNPKMVKELVKKGLVDYVAMDIKASKQKYMKAIGLDRKLSHFGPGQLDLWEEEIIDNLQQTIDFLKQDRVDCEFRTTVVPGLLSRDDIFQIIKWISPAKRYYLQDFESHETVNPKFRAKKSYERQYLLEILRYAKPFFKVCELRAD